MDRYEEWTRYLGWWVANALEREGYELNRATGTSNPVAPPDRWSRLRRMLSGTRAR